MRIWVTGIGVVSPLARGAERTMDRLLAGDRAIGPLQLFHLDGCRVDIVAEVHDLRVAEVAPGGDPEGWSRTDAMSVLAAREALAQAGVDPRAMAVDLVLGGTTAGMFETEAPLAELSRELLPDLGAPHVVPPEAVAPLKRMLSHPLSSTADHVASALGPFGSVRTVCSACSGGANAILLAAAWLRAGRSRCVIAGGADALCRLTFTGFGALAALSPEPCRPFDRRRSGLNLGEGAAFLVLEPEDAARARGARPIVELRGWAVGAEANHITNPEGSGETAARVMREALARAGLTPADVDYVNAHGTATPLNDSMEAAALRRCLGAEIGRIPVSSSKGQIGHTLAACGAIEAAITAMAITRGVLPPTIGLEEVDPACELVHVTAARPARIRAAMSDSFGFGGTDAVLVLAALDAFPEPAWPPTRAVVVTGAATVGALGVLGVTGTHAYLEPGPPPEPGRIAFVAGDHLDVARARRLDRPGKLTTAAIARALLDAGVDVAGQAERVGAVVGSAFGSIEGCTAFMRRVYDKGPKLASPADFPNLVPSSPVGHASIYLGLRGPVLATADLDASAESAFVTAAELIAAGEGDVIAAGSVEEASPMIERCLGPICSGITDRGARSEGAAVLLLEAEETARRRGVPILAGVAWWGSWRGPAGVVVTAPLAGAPRPPTPAGAAVFVGRDDERVRTALEGSPWAEVPRHGVAARAGDHEGAGGFAAAAAVAALAAGDVESALLLGTAPDRGYAALLVRPREQGGRAGAPSRPCWRSALVGCAPPVAASVAEPAPSLAEWQRALAILGRLRRTAAVASTRRIALELREPRTGRVLSARGAVAVLPPRALRMILLGPGGTTALDLWASGDAYRFAVPAIDLKKRGDLRDPREERRGLPVDFLAFWLLRPAGGRLLWYGREAGGDRFVLRDGAAIVDLRAFDDGRVEARRATWSSPTGDGARPQLLDEETVSADRLGCAGVRYHQRSTGLSVKVTCEAETPGEPPARALVDPDAEAP